jgi:uncharacterized membrane protein
LPEKTRIKKIFSAFFEQDYPADLILVMLWLVAGIIAIYLPVLNVTPVRYVITIPLVLFIPGYCLIAALFPKEGDISLIERIAFSFGLSIAIIPLMGLGLNFTPWGIQLDPVVISLTFFTYVMILIAFYRRSLLPQKERFRIPFSDMGGTIGKKIFSAESSKADRILSFILVIVIIISVIITIYVMVNPREGEQFTEFYILGENRTVANYPDIVNAGQKYPLFIGVGNHENRDVTYMIETWILHTEFDNMTNTSRIIAMDPTDYLSFTLAENQTAIIPYNLSVKETGYDRMEFLLFNETVPGIDVTGSDRINASYRDLHLVINVS